MNSGFPDRHVPAEETTMATPAEECLLNVMAQQALPDKESSPGGPYC
jgi:hypothetical protein